MQYHETLPSHPLAHASSYFRPITTHTSLYFPSCIPSAIHIGQLTTGSHMAGSQRNLPSRYSRRNKIAQWMARFLGQQVHDEVWSDPFQKVMRTTLKRSCREDHLPSSLVRTRQRGTVRYLGHEGRAEGGALFYFPHSCRFLGY